MFSSVPSWVKRFQDPSIRLMLKTLHKNTKGGIDAPREMNFTLYNYESEQKAARATQEPISLGWACEVIYSQDGTYEFNATKSDYIIDEVILTRDINVFMDVAEKTGGLYDGWFAST